MKSQGLNPTSLFVTGSVLGALSCFSRADYNLPLFAFLAVMWNQDDVSNKFTKFNRDYFDRMKKTKLDFY